MAFRNEQDALRERVEILERELARTRQRLEEREQAAAEAIRRASELEKELAEAKKELARLAPRSSRKDARPYLGLALGVGMVALVGAVTALGTKPSASSDLSPVVPPAMVSNAAPVVQERMVAHEARVLEVTGWPPLRPGDACRVESTLRSSGQSLDVGRVQVRCGEHVLYDSAAPATGVVISSTSWAVFERRVPGDVERYAYGVDYEDQGTRALPMAQLVLRTSGRAARVFRSPESEGSVLLDVQAWSAPLEGPPALPASVGQPLAFAEPLELALEVDGVEGQAPIAADAACTLHVAPQLPDARFDCRVLVRCGATVLYGAGTSGFNDCAIEQDRVTRIDDGAAYTDGDPELHFDAAAGTLALRDAPPAGEWTARFRVRASE